MRELLFPLALVLSSIVAHQWQERAKKIPADPLPDGSGYVLRPHWFWRLVGLTIVVAWCFAFIRPALLNGFQIKAPQNISLLSYGLISVLLLLPGLAMLLHSRRRVLLLDDRIECISGFGLTTPIPWHEMKSVTYSLFGYFSFVSHSGKGFKVGAKRKGLPTLVRYIKQRLDPMVYYQAFSPLSGFKEP